MKNQHRLRLFIAFCAVLMAPINGTAFAQDVAAAARLDRAQSLAATSDSLGILAKTKCLSQSYVLVTSDSERAIPLHWVAKLDCDEEIRVLSDEQGYTLRVRTKDGTVGYVTRLEVVIVPKAPSPAAASGADAAASQAPAQGETKPAIEAFSLVPGNEASKPRVYVSDTKSWTSSGGFSRSSSIPEGKLYGGYDPEMADVYQGFISICPAVVVTQQKADATYAVLFDKGTSKTGLAGLHGLVKVNKVTLLSRTGETVLEREARSVDTVVTFTCEAIMEKSNSKTVSQTHP